MTRAGFKLTVYRISRSFFSRSCSRLRLPHWCAAQNRAGIEKDDYRCALGRFDVELCRLSGFYPQPRNCGLATDVADANVRLGHGRRDRGYVVWESTLVRGRVTSGALAARYKPFSRRTCATVFRIGGSSVSFTSHSGIIVGVAFLMLTRRCRPYPVSLVRVWLWSEFYFVVTLVVDELTGFNYGFLTAQAGSIFHLEFSLRFVAAISLANARSGTALLSRALRALCCF